jgi:hypothetical protein
MKFRLLIGLLLVATTARAQSTSTAVIPVVGSVFGPTMIRWLTDVELVNDTGLEVDVALELTAGDGSPMVAFTLSPGQTQRFTDIVGQAFGLDAALSPLRITTAGRRGLTVRAQAYAVRQGELSPPQPIATYGPDTYYPIRVLDGLVFSDDYRTNIGLVNFGERPAEFLLAAQRIPGRNVAVTSVSVGPGSLVHVAVQALFPLITRGEGFSVVVETAARDTHVYASVVENATNAGKFVVPRAGNR